VRKNAEKNALAVLMPSNAQVIKTADVRAKATINNLIIKQKHGYQLGR